MEDDLHFRAKEKLPQCFGKFGLKKDFKMLKSFFKPNFQNKGWYKQVWYIHDAVH